MAAPTLTTYREPYLVHTISGSNVDAGNNDYDLKYSDLNQGKGFSIVTGTLTNMTITLLASNDDSTFVDVTALLCDGATSLASSSAYIGDIAYPMKTLRIRAARSNATNAIALSVFVPKR